MPYKVPIQQALTDTQADVTAKLGAMNNLLKLPFLPQKNVPKNQQISVYDYALKIFKILGVDLEHLFIAFFNQILDPNKLSRDILLCIARVFAKDGKRLSPNSQIILSTPMTKKQELALENENYNFLNALFGPPLVAVISAMDKQIMKDLMLLIFGPPSNPTTTSMLNSDPVRANDIYSDAICGAGGGIFSISNEPYVRNQDLEYTRAQMLTQIKNSAFTYSVTCQGVTIAPPSNPTYMFTGGVPGSISSNTLTPGQTFSFMVNYTASQVQQQNGGQNANSAAKAFAQSTLETFISHIMILLKPFFMGFVPNPDFAAGYEGILSVLYKEGQNGTAGADALSAGSYAPLTSCDLILNFNNSTPTPSSPLYSQTRIITEISNIILKELISFLVNLLIKEIKKMIIHFFAKNAAEKEKRRQQKIKDSYALSSATTDASQAGQYSAALQGISPLIAPTPADLA